MGTDSLVDRGSDRRTTSRISKAEQWRNVQGLSETEVSGDRWHIKWLSTFSNEEDKRRRSLAAAWKEWEYNATQIIEHWQKQYFIRSSLKNFSQYVGNSHQYVTLWQQENKKGKY